MILSFYMDGDFRKIQISDDIYTNTKEIWENFKKNIIYQNRFFSGKEISAILAKLNFMPVFPRNTHLTYYRARIGDYLKSDDAEMMAPPARSAVAGRCNPNGIPYLYLASSKATAIQEIKPQIGDIVTVATFNVDMSNVFSFNVYLMEHYGIVAKDEQAKCLLLLILEELSSAVTVENQLNYIPLQYVCEYIKNLGYDAFIYTSAYRTGANLVMFHWPDKVSLCKKEVVYIKNTDIQWDTFTMS